MSEFNKSKVNKKPFESRSDFMLRLAKQGVQENSENTVVSAFLCNITILYIVFMLLL